MAPKGSAGVDIVNIGYTVPIKPQGVNPVVHELAITGAGSLTVTANSKNGYILCSGDPLRFANQGATHIESEGDGSKIELKFAGSPSAQDSLIFTGGAVQVVADNPQHDGGTIIVTADKVKNTASSVKMHANALSDGAGGTVSLDIDRGNLSLGTATGTMSLAATGMGSGKGGSISVENAKHNGTITLDPTFSTAAVSVAALGSNGDGGTIDLHADHLVNNATSGNSGLVANGAGSGKGGHISLRLTEDVTIGGAPGLVVTAVSTGSGNGGDVDIVSTKGSLVIDAGTINANGGSDGKGGNITAKTLQPGSTLTVNGSLTANGQNTKKGGNIKVIAAGMLNIATAQFHADGGQRGAGGSVELSAAGDLTVNAGQVTALAGTLGSNKGGDITLTTTGTGDLTAFSELNVNGSGNGAGGLLKLTSAGKVNVSDAQLLAKGGSMGKGGTIEISAVKNVLASTMNASGKTSGGTISVTSQDAITLDEGTPTFALQNTPGIDVSGENGDGGQIVLTAGSSTTGDLTIQASLSASSTGSGNGGSVTANAGNNLIINDTGEVKAITATAGPSAPDGTGGGITATAGISMTVIGKIESNGAGNGRGGTILLTSNGTFDIATTGASITANGGDGDGRGGVIAIFPTVPMSLSNLNTEVFSARGKNHGGGGEVTLRNIATRDFKVLDVVNVDAGSTAPWDIPVGLGSITINTTKCRQRRLDDNSRAWPKRYWLAKGDNAPIAEDLAPMQLAIEARCDKFRSLFEDNKVEIFVFRDYGAYFDFTQDLKDAAAGSITFPLGTFKYVNVWQKGATGEGQNGTPLVNDYSPQQIREVAAHEFGHAYQLSKPVSVAQGSGWASLKDDDLNHLDTGSPCDASSGPFRGVVDLNHADSQGQPAPQTICDETTHTLRSDYQGKSNRDILIDLGFNSQFFSTVDPARSNAELHAQMFALALVGNLGVRPMFDGIVDNGYFPKLKAFAVAEVQ